MIYPEERDRVISTQPFLWSLLCIIVACAANPSRAGDWPMWRHNVRRDAVSPEKLPGTLHLQWIREQARVRPAFATRRLQFDAGYEPVVMGKTLFMGSPCHDTVSAIDTDTGEEKWVFYTDGPVRFAPVAWKGRVYVASDDGSLYCLDAATGRRLWAFRAVPSQRKVIGNGRVISAWPIRGGPVLKDGRIYFAAGIWPFEGIFVYALDADTGRVIWLNDRCGSLYLGHPHGAWSFGGPSLQGYLLINGQDLIVPNGTGGVPAYFDIETGELQAFTHLANRVPGSWFVAGGPKGQLHVDPNYNRELHEDRFYETKWSARDPWVSPQKLEPWTGRKWAFSAGSRQRISVGGQTYDFAQGFPGVQGKVCSMIAADSKMFVVTDRGHLYCFGTTAVEPKQYETSRLPLSIRQDKWHDEVTRLVQATGKSSGYALVWGVGTGRLIEELVQQTQMHVIAVDPDSKKVDALRRRFGSAGLYGKRVVIHTADPVTFDLPPYLASLIVSEDVTRAGISRGSQWVEKMFESLRPYGGTACLPLSSQQTQNLGQWVKQAKLPNARLEEVDGMILLRRPGALPGTVNYDGQWSSPDALVKAPLGVLWFDDSVRQFKRSPQPKVIDGVMISQPKAWLTTVRPYTLKKPTYADVYTGRVLTRAEALDALKTLPEADQSAQPAHYKPPVIHKDNVWAERINPVTLLKEPRHLPKSYGCEPGVDYGHMITMRSGTGAFYDKRLESGLINISGIRTGCTNSLIPANGVLNVPYFYEGCTCGYPLACGLGMVNMPETFEQWMAWGDSEFENRLKRLGINFGAPGDRMTETGTLWLDYPSVGGPSPRVSLTMSPQNVDFFYRHSLWVEGGEGMPWIVASGVKGVTKLSIDLLPAGHEGDDPIDPLTYSVRLFFAEPEDIKPGQRVFSVKIQDKEVLRALDVTQAAGGRMRGIVKEFEGIRIARTLDLTLTAQSNVPILSGIELVLDQ